MLLCEFPGQNVIIAKDQPEYIPMPAHVAADGTVTCCWRLTWRERLRLLRTGTVWHQILTFRAHLQPQILTTERPQLEAIGELPEANMHSLDAD
jgi:hypothetical protein